MRVVEGRGRADGNGDWDSNNGLLSALGRDCNGYSFCFDWVGRCNHNSTSCLHVLYDRIPYTCHPCFLVALPDRFEFTPAGLGVSKQTAKQAGCGLGPTNALTWHRFSWLASHWHSALAWFWGWCVFKGCLCIRFAHFWMARGSVIYSTSIRFATNPYRICSSNFPLSTAIPQLWVVWVGCGTGCLGGRSIPLASLAGSQGLVFSRHPDASLLPSLPTLIDRLHHWGSSDAMAQSNGDDGDDDDVDGSRGHVGPTPS